MSGRGLGLAIAQKAHNEGRKAFAAGKTERDNPYNGRAVKDSDEWLRYNGWKNGWTFAWFVDAQKQRKLKTAKKTR